MTNKNKKKTLIILLLIFLGLLTYNLFNPYLEKQSDRGEYSYASSSSSFSDDEISSIDDSKGFEEIVEREPSQEKIWQKKYKGNRLKNGSEPYRALYGRNRQSGTSEIVVTAPIDMDALVMVKLNNNVKQHAYIRSGKRYTFHISAGLYQVYFICGTDWCPEKDAPNGQKGFFLNSSTSKDDALYVDNYQSLTYTLQSSIHGNFRPQGARSDEAF